MKKKYIYQEIEYILIEDYEKGFDNDEVEKKVTDYFAPYDYIIGDWAYGKLRLKGFCKKENSMCNKFNNIENKKEYIKNKCAYDCKYFILEKKS